jgi:hypothetical protein
MPLTNTAIKNAQPKQKPFKLSDGNGMYLLVNSTSEGSYYLGIIVAPVAMYLIWMMVLGNRIFPPVSMFTE